MALNRSQPAHIDQEGVPENPKPTGPAKDLSPSRSMCACADSESNWRGHGLSARYVCTCGGKTVSATGLRWLS